MSNDPTTSKAKVRSVSFTDDELYIWAATHGKGLKPSQSASTVICTAIEEYKQRNTPAAEEAQLLAAARKVGLGRAIAAIASLRRPSKRTT